MPRPRILPLPDELARPIARGVQAIEAARPGSSNREFLREFVPLVVEVTGELFGAQTFQKLLRQMAPHRTPSSTTVHDEIHKYRSEGRAEAQLAPSDPPRRSVNAIVDIATLNRTGSRRIDTESVSRDEAALAAVELGKLHQLEVERLRSRAEIMEARATAADAARQGAVADAIAARAEAVGLQEAVANFQTLVKQLSETIQLTQERAAADNRANLLRVDEVRRETREVEEKLKAAQSTIVLREQALRNSNALGDSLRQQLNELRRQLQVRDE